MGNASGSLTFDQSKSKNLHGVLAKATCVLLLAQTMNGVVFLTSYSADPHVRIKAFDVCLKFKVEFGLYANPVIGLFHVEPDLNDLWLRDNPDVSYWDLKKGQIVVRGREVPDLYLPECKSGAVVDVTATAGQFTLVVTNPGEPPRRSFFELPGLSSNDLGFVGALQTGRKQVKFQLLDKEGKALDSTGNNLIDLTANTTFDGCYGVISVSPDRKSLSRTASHQGNGYGLLNPIISKGIHRIKVSITCDFGASLCVGVARYPFRLSAEYVKDHMKHIYRHPGLLLWRSYRGLLYADGKQQDKTTEALGWQHGDTIFIELIVNMEERTIEILKNDISLGIIFTDIPEVVQPVVCFYAAYEKTVTLVSYRVSENAVKRPTARPRSSLHKSVILDQSTAPIPAEVQFDPNGKFGHITMTNDKKTIYREKNQAGNSLSILNMICDKNRQYRFSFVIENDQGASVCIGVTDVVEPKDIQISGIGNIYSSPSLYVYRSFQGMLYHKGQELTKHFEEYWMTGTLVEMIVDIDETEAVVQYSINGSDQGIAFSHLRPPLRPLVGFYAGMEKRITLIHFESNPKSTSKISRVTSDCPANTFGVKTTEHASLQLNVTLPILLRTSSIDNYYSTCMTCGKPCDSIALPCKHAFMCAEHLSEHVLQNRSCFLCDSKVTGMWNILKL